MFRQSFAKYAAMLVPAHCWRRRIREWHETFLFTAFVLTHRETDKGWVEKEVARPRGRNRFPYSKSTYLAYNRWTPTPHSRSRTPRPLLPPAIAAACRFLAKFSGDPGNCEKRRGWRGVACARRRGEATIAHHPRCTLASIPFQRILT